MSRVHRKPEGSVVLDRSGLGRDLRCALLMDGSMKSSTDVHVWDYARRKFIKGTSNGTPMAHGVGAGGKYMRGTTAAHFIVEDDEIDVFGVEIPAAVTIGMIRRKVDTTLRAAHHWGFLMPSDGLSRIFSHMPHSNGNVYFDHGADTVDAGRIIWAGYSVTTNIEYWLFHCGPAGSAIWFDGIKRNSNVDTTMISGAQPRQLFVNQNRGSTTAGDEVEVYLFFVADKQWSDVQINNWFKRPYDSLFKPAHRRLYVQAAAAGLVGPLTRGGSLLHGSLIHGGRLAA